MRYFPKHMSIALSQYGIKEHAGSKHNDSVLKYFSDFNIHDDETSWCGAFVHWCLKQSNYPDLPDSSLSARSWIKYGKAVDTPSLGDIVVFWREKKDSWKGHVGFFICFSEDGKDIFCLGGNQGNMVSVKPYPANRLLAFRKI